MDVSLQKLPKILEIAKPKTTEDEIKELKLKVDSMSRMFFLFRKIGLEKKTEVVDNDGPLLNKDGIPVNTCYIGYVKTSRHPYILIVNEKGEYTLGAKTFGSLSSAAEYVSGVRRSGWTFWHTLEGIPLKELYK